MLDKKYDGSDFANESETLKNFNKTGSKIIELYERAPDTMGLEAEIEMIAIDNGEETEALHMLYMMHIRGFVRDIAEQHKLFLACPISDPDAVYSAYYAADVISDVIYNQRKFDLGLTSKNLTYKDFSVDVALQICEESMDRATLFQMMQKVEDRVVGKLDQLNLHRTEQILFPWGMLIDPCAFHKILVTVMECGTEDQYHLTDLDPWVTLVAFYEIANRIYTKYSKGEK